MEVEVIGIGGYSYIGKNMTAIRIDDEIIIIDAGINVDKVQEYEDTGELNKLSKEDLYNLDIIPDDRILENYKEKVKAIIITHGHLDHVGAVNIIAPKYNVPIYCTPYVYNIIKQQEKDTGIVLHNDIKKISPNSEIKISDKIKVRLINITHSIPQSVMIDVITEKGHIIHSGDFKFDNYPIIGKKPSYEIIKSIGKERVLLLISETTRAEEESKSPSEIIAKYMLYDVLFSIDTKGIMVSTFSSHIARLKTIVEISYELNRKPIFIGRSLGKYIKAAEDINLYNFSEVSEIVDDPREYKNVLRKVENNKEEYLLIVTGHQGEPGSVLDKIAKNQLSLDLEDTTIVFANNVIPNPINEANRKILEERLKRKKAHIIKDVHVSGHAKAEDHRMLIKMLNPENIIPNHGDIIKKAAYYKIVENMGYSLGKNVFFIEDGQRQIFNF